MHRLLTNFDHFFGFQYKYLFAGKMDPQANLNEFQGQQSFSWPIIWNHNPAVTYPAPFYPWPYCFANSIGIPPYSSQSYPLPEPQGQPNSQLVQQQQTFVAANEDFPQELGIIPVKVQQQSPSSNHPSQDIVRRGSAARTRQKFGRNILSNIFHMAIKKIFTNEFSKHLELSIKKWGLCLTVVEFRGRLSQKQKLSSSYISAKSIKKLLVGNPIGATRADIDFRKLLRILIKIYLHQYHIPHLYHSGKIKKQSRLLHLSTLRKLNKRIAKL